jgi:hypothetical protein
MVRTETPGRATATLTARYCPGGFCESVRKASTYCDRSSSSIRCVTSVIFDALPIAKTSPCLYTHLTLPTKA